MALAALLLVLALAACGGGDTLHTETGIVVDIQAQGLARIDGFTLRTSDGRELTFDTTQTRFDATGFPPQHLQEHRALADPVKVTYQEKDGRNAVVKLEDAAR
ncbi:MAG: hypothetical protein U0869_05790 [Chloroflexota bacterium]